ncbi:MAG: prephenate dehydrogenase/arogenate dehydrogenase family protein [Desulfobacterales bacterium]|nr:prephenate dehydrogenase/arogenate dehydrogenase family protein [Desulfobacterales bacterium]
MACLFDKVAIIGLGLIGGSLAKAAKGENLFKKVVGIGRNEKNLKKGFDLGAIDSYTTHLAEGVSDVDLVVVATPPGVIIEIIKKVVPYIPDGCIITDVGSIKKEIVKGVEKFIPDNDNIYFVGGHPIAGTENSGIEAADPSLFIGHKCVLTPTSKTNRSAFERIKTMWEKVGCKVISMDMTKHDYIFAVVSHLPHVVAFSLINAIMNIKDPKEDILSYSAGGLKDFTRVAASNPTMWKDIFLMNKENVLNSITDFQSSLEEIKRDIAEEDSEKLVSEFQKSREVRRAIK